MTSLLDLELNKNALVVLIGPSGAGKTTLARTWPASQVLSLDTLRGAVSDEPGCQEATADAVDVLHLLLERRMARKATTVIDATNVTGDARAPLVAAAKRHGMHTVAVMMSTPASVCVERQGPRPANRSVPQDTVRSQHQAMVRSHPMLLSEGFNEVVFASSLCRLEPFLQQLSEAREADLGDDESEGLGDLLLVRQYFGPEILPLWRWKHGSDIAGGDRVAEIRLGQQYLILALRTDADGDYGFDALLPCPVDPECAGPAWAPVYSVTDLYKALTGSLDSDPDTVCTEHGPDDPEGRADLEQQYADAVRA
ncbi:ATP-binding protein [Streptomyces sp. NPDC051080]|uniref:ATP-binding protein n=1 Tax=Streptomyces sp. NPDC051080 TaxID=3157222 RepID=UPI00343F9978